MKTIFQIATILVLLSACRPSTSIKTEDNGVSEFYSKMVNDSFSIFVSVPVGYDTGGKNKYPVVYLLDANLYFDIMATTIRKYTEVGLLAPVILVGIGYKDLAIMDSLRTRDYTYPLAIPEYEMSVSGQADKFFSFIKDELLPHIDTRYSVDTTNRILLGHSLGGYFIMYAVQQSLLDKHSIFSGYIAASPSTHYNHNYLLTQLEKLGADIQDKTKLYVTFGGLEDAEEDEGDTTMLKTNQILSALSTSLENKINYKGETFSNLGHMDTPFPTFVKGLQWTMNKTE